VSGRSRVKTVEDWKEGRRKGGKARASALTPERRKEIAQKAAAKRWSKTNRIRTSEGEVAPQMPGSQRDYARWEKVWREADDEFLTESAKDHFNGTRLFAKTSCFWQPLARPEETPYYSRFSHRVWPLGSGTPRRIDE